MYWNLRGKKIYLYIVCFFLFLINIFFFLVIVGFFVVLIFMNKVFEKVIKLILVDVSFNNKKKKIKCNEVI